jgi:hypothetical protein
MNAATASRVKAGVRSTAFAALMVASGPAAARDRLAVLMAAEGDAALANNLTEVAISTLAERRDRELVGMRELREGLTEILREGGLEACVTRPACLARVGVAARAERAVIGTVHRTGDELTLELSLTDLRTARHEARLSRTIPADMGGLVAALQEGLSQLFQSMAPPIQSKEPALPPATPPPLHLDLPKRAESREETGRSRSSLPAYLGFGAAALAVVAFSGAVVRASLATAPPMGETRAETQADLERRKGYARVANELWLAGGTLTAASAAAFFWWWRAGRAHAHAQ